MRLLEPVRRIAPVLYTIALAVSFLWSSPAGACMLAHDPARSNSETRVVLVQMKPGERCTVLDRNSYPNWLPSLEKIGIVQPGRNGRLHFDRRAPEAWSRPRYVYAGRPGVTGRDVATLEGTGFVNGRLGRIAVRFEIDAR